MGEAILTRRGKAEKPIATYNYSGWWIQPTGYYNITTGGTWTPTPSQPNHETTTLIPIVPDSKLRIDNFNMNQYHTINLFNSSKQWMRAYTTSGTPSSWANSAAGLITSAANIPDEVDLTGASFFAVFHYNNVGISLSDLNIQYDGTEEILQALIPRMTANNAPSGYVASAASDYGSTYAAWKAFDIYESTQWISNLTSSSGSWVQIQLPSAVVVKRHGRMYNDGYTNIGGFPRTVQVTFQGSNNGSTWSTISTFNITATPDYDVAEFDLTNNNTAYSYYRWTYNGYTSADTYPSYTVRLSMVQLYG